MPGPRQLWKTTIVVWSEDDPQKMEMTKLINIVLNREGVVTKRESELVSDPYSQEDGPPEGFFERDT